MSAPPVPRRSGLSLSERADVTRELEREHAAQAADAGTHPSAGIRPAAAHCWVAGLPAAPGRWPGVVTEWRTTTRGWEGHVAYAVLDGATSVLITAWVPAEHLTPAGGPPSPA